MAKTLTDHKLHKLLRDYILELSGSGQYVPEWLFDARFYFDPDLNDCFAQLDPESNCVVYGKGTTVHAILHELEHLRSRHKEMVKGYDEERERFVYFYFVGYRTSGINGLFLEEALNELSARKIEMKMFGTSKKAQMRLVNEYKTNKYYTFEIFMTLGLCSLLGIKVEDVKNLKFAGDASGQESLSQLVGFMAGDDKYWLRMQESLDDFEMSKRLPLTFGTRSEMQREKLYEYYKLAYRLIVNAYNRKIISSAEAGRAVYLFEEYSKKAGEYCKHAESMRQKAKTTVTNQNKSAEKLFLNSERCVIRKEDEKQYAIILPRGSNVVPGRVSKAILDGVGRVFVKTDRYELLEENMYGL